MRTVVHLSDIHFGRVDRRILPSLIQTITRIAPDLLAVSGDLTQRARRWQFAEARAFLQQLPFPTLVVPGNHDVPLFNLAARFVRPFASYRRYIEKDLEPVFEDAELVAVGLNSARALPFHGGGRLNEGQVARAAIRLRAAPADAVKMVVTHHPFDVPQGHGDHDLVGRSAMAMEKLAAVGADIFLAGHLHVSHIGHTAERYQIAGHSALVVQAGTLSTRERGELNSFNVLRFARPAITVEHLTWTETAATFATSRLETFAHTPDGWH